MNSSRASLFGGASVILGVTAICLVGCKKVDNQPQQPQAAITITATTDNSQAAADNNSDSSDGNSSDDAQADNEKLRPSSPFVRWMGGTWADLLVDNETGCEYIVAYKTGRQGGEVLPPFPRMGKDHQQICRDQNTDVKYKPKLDSTNPAYVETSDGDKSSDDKPKVKH